MTDGVCWVHDSAFVIPDILNRPSVIPDVFNRESRDFSVEASGTPEFESVGHVCSHGANGWE